MTHRVSFRAQSFRADSYGNYDTLYTHNQPDGGRIYVLNRSTGYGFRDVETGYKSPCGKFWLASGVDIRAALPELSSDNDMAAWVIERANNCVASLPYRGYNYVTHDELMRWDSRGGAEGAKP
jgi:hypothetical protein